MIVLTSPTPITHEIAHIQSMFQLGLPQLHLRKPSFSMEDTFHFLEKIGPDYHSKIVLHNHFELIRIFPVLQIHLNTSKRNTHSFDKLQAISTSTHGIKTFNTLKGRFIQAFLGPVFPSISKPDYQSEHCWETALSKRTNFSTVLVALGGMTPRLIPKIYQMGFDDYALLGCIWHAPNPLQIFKECIQNDPMF